MTFVDKIKFFFRFYKLLAIFVDLFESKSVNKESFLIVYEQDSRSAKIFWNVNIISDIFEHPRILMFMFKMYTEPNK